MRETLVRHAFVGGILGFLSVLVHQTIAARGPDQQLILAEPIHPATPMTPVTSSHLVLLKAAACITRTDAIDGFRAHAIAGSDKPRGLLAHANLMVICVGDDLTEAFDDRLACGVL